MTSVKINDGNDDKYNVGLKPIVDLKYLQIINPRECGIEIAYELFDSEDVSAEEIYEYINEKLSEISSYICDECIDVLRENGVEVQYY